MAGGKAGQQQQVSSAPAKEKAAPPAKGAGATQQTNSAPSKGAKPMQQEQATSTPSKASSQASKSAGQKQQEPSSKPTKGGKSQQASVAPSKSSAQTQQEPVPATSSKVAGQTQQGQAVAAPSKGASQGASKTPQDQAPVTPPKSKSQTQHQQEQGPATLSKGTKQTQQEQAPAPPSKSAKASQKSAAPTPLVSGKGDQQEQTPPATVKSAPVQQLEADTDQQQVAEPTQQAQEQQEQEVAPSPSSSSPKEVSDMSQDTQMEQEQQVETEPQQASEPPTQEQSPAPPAKGTSTPEQQKEQASEAPPSAQQEQTQDAASKGAPEQDAEQQTEQTPVEKGGGVSTLSKVQESNATKPPKRVAKMRLAKPVPVPTTTIADEQPSRQARISPSTSNKVNHHARAQPNTHSSSGSGSSSGSSSSSGSGSGSSSGSGSGSSSSSGSGSSSSSSSRLNSCDRRVQTDCVSKTGCFWTGTKCTVRIAWLHVMKTASSFGTTLAHHANARLPRDAHIPSGMNKSDPEDMPTRAVDMQEKHLVLDFFEYKYPVDKWFKGVFRFPENPGEHRPIMENEWDQWNGFWVTILRQPEERTSSAWHHFGEGKGNMFKFQKAIQGQQANMLSAGHSGIARVNCERNGGNVLRHLDECDNAVVPNVSLAIKRLREFAFVGILEEYDMSICLFHAVFGGKCLAVEFLNSRPTHYEESEAAQEAEEAKLKKYPDPWDTPVYEAAMRRFKADVRKYKLNNSTCRKMCPGGPF
eukprot:TRINITY_DN1159_c0_g2_i1.p1 TRINITY_DN1159_c0_g2~~TRINITY_DN1159_c0_g2_i1.p1  ORF type:complete len:764 (+),score=147.16 TRINITY_DN1159_c0_g2_i1:38-2293(+)